MGIRGSIRFWRKQGVYALLAMAFCVGAVADTATTTSTAKKPAQTHASHAGTSHATSSHSTSAHSASSHGTAAHSTSHAKSSTAKAHTTTSKAQSGHTTSKSANKHSSRSKKTAKKRGQQVIDSDRARQIQEALIREHYLTGEPSGTWDSATQAAMQRYQADQGWQNKTTPDSRALIKLGLGPNNDHLLNPESAMTSAPPVTSGGDATSKVNSKLPAESTPPPATDPNSSTAPSNQPNR